MQSKLTPDQLDHLRREYPFLPQDYIDYMVTVGWGQAESGVMIYEAPTSSRSVYGDAFRRHEIVLLGDDYQGYCFGFNPISGRYGEINTRGAWEEWPDGRGIQSYIDARAEE